MPPDKKRYLVVSLHDFSPKHEAEYDIILQELKKQAITPLSVLVVPNHDNRFPLTKHPQFVKKICELYEQESEIILHGYNHLRSNATQVGTFLYKKQKGEFGLCDYPTAVSLLSRSMNLLDRNSFQVTGFIAPWWSMSKASIDAIEDHGFSYTTFRNRILVLGSRNQIYSNALEYTSTSWVMDKCSMLYNKLLLNTTLKNSNIIRVPIHPDDILGSKPFYGAINQIKQLLQQGTILTTYSNYIDQFQTHATTVSLGRKGS